MLAQHFKPLPGNACVAVLDGSHDTGDTRINQSLGAGRCLALMGTGFERYIGSRPTRLGTCLGKSHRFCMRPATRLGPAASDYAAILHDNAANRRIRPAVALPAPSKRQRQGHETFIHAGYSSVAGVGGRSS